MTEARLLEARADLELLQHHSTAAVELASRAACTYRQLGEATAVARCLVLKERACGGAPPAEDVAELEEALAGLDDLGEDVLSNALLAELLGVYARAADFDRAAAIFARVRKPDDDEET